MYAILAPSLSFMNNLGEKCAKFNTSGAKTDPILKGVITVHFTTSSYII